jgi:hypothetical protein
MYTNKNNFKFLKGKNRAYFLKKVEFLSWEILIHFIKFLLPETIEVLFFLFCFVFWVGLEFELRALHLQSRCSTASATSLVHFGLVILKVESGKLFACAALPTVILQILAFQVARS